MATTFGTGFLGVEYFRQPPGVEIPAEPVGDVFAGVDLGQPVPASS